MKKILVILCIVLFVGFIQPCKAGTFFDDFNDGNTDGWLPFSPYPGRSSDLGNWRLVDGTVKQDDNGDHFKFLLNNYSLSSQTVEAKVLTSNYAGITIWYQDEKNWVDVFYPYGLGIRVMEVIDGEFSYGDYPAVFNEVKWQAMKINANSVTGEISVYLDGEYLFTHTAVTNNRTGLSGISSGNGGGSFDDFSVTADSISPSKDDCKKDNWNRWLNPTFKNQGSCVNFSKQINN